MIKVFPSNAKSFSSNGLVVIKPLKCIEYKKKSLNGWYIECEVPIKYKQYIQKDNLIVLKTKSKLRPQAFRIDSPTKNSRILSFKANHVMYDSQNLFLDDVRPTNMSAKNALEYINVRTDKESPFSYTSDIVGTNTAYFLYKSLFEAWATIEERWGGNFDADNFDITFSNNLGKNVGEMIVYQKNSNDIKIYEDWSEVCTRIYPKGDNDLKLPEKYIDADIQYNIPYTKTETFYSQLKSDNNDIPQEDLILELRDNALNYLEKNKYPKVSYQLSANIKEIYDVNDKIIVKHPLVNLKTEVQEYTYDHKTKKTTNIVFGNFSQNVFQKVSSLKDSISKALDVGSNNLQLINNQTDLINSLNKLGHFYNDGNEVFFLDKLPKEEAQNVLRIGLGGIGFSKTGIEGPFINAWTIDGKLNADFIQTGHINTSLIEGYDDLLLKVSETIDRRTTIEHTGYVEVRDAYPERALRLEVTGNMNTYYPSTTEYPSIYRYPGYTPLIIEGSEETKTLLFPIKYLRYIDEDNYDKFVITDTSAYIERMDGTRENLVNTTLYLFEDYNKIYFPLYKDLNYKIVYVTKSDYTKEYVIREEMNASINIAKNEINSNVNVKLEGYSTTYQMNNIIDQKISDSENEIALRVKNEVSPIMKVEGTGIITFHNVAESEPYNITIKAKNSDISYLYPSDDLFPSEDLYPIDRKLILENGTNIIEYELPTNLLHLNNDVYDEFHLDYESHRCYVIHRVGLDVNNEKYKLENELEEEFDYPEFHLVEGTYQIYLDCFSNAYIYAELMEKNEFTSQMSSKVELQASIDLMVRKDDNGQVISMINASADLINLKGNRVEIHANNFDLDRYGNIKCRNAELTGMFSNYSSNGNLAVRISGTLIKFYDYEGTGNLAGVLCSTRDIDTHQIIGINLYTIQGNRVTLGYKDNESDTTINSLLQFDTRDTTAPPYIANTVSGTLFGDNPNGGITVQNGLITSWGLRGRSLQIKLYCPDAGDVMFTFANGLLTNIELCN